MTPDVMRTFQDSTLFAGLLPDAWTMRFTDGQRLSEYADDQRSVGVIVRGLADIWCPASDGTWTLLNTIRHGDCFGIAYLTEGEAMLTRVEAKGACEAVFIRKSLIRSLLMTDAAFAERYYALCNRKLRFLLSQISILTAQSCRTRLIAYLLCHRDADNCVALHGAKDDLASRLSVSRAAVYRELGELKQRGLICPEKRQIRVPDPEKLEAFLYDRKESANC